MDFVTLLQEKLGQIATVLTGDASDERPFHPGIKSKSPSKAQESDFGRRSSVRPLAVTP